MAYPDNCPSAYPSQAEYRCKDCGEAWHVFGKVDLGMFAADREQDEQCPKCGSWDVC